MNHWDLRIIRAAVLHDIRAFIPALHYSPNADAIQLGTKDATIAQALLFATNPEMSARQYAACEVLVWLGMYTANHDALGRIVNNKLENYPGCKSVYAQLAENEKSFIESLTICLRRYCLHLPATEASPLLSFLPDTPSKKTKVDPGEVKDRLSFLKTTDKKLNEFQEDERDCLLRAKELWKENPNLNKTEIMKSQELAPYVRKYAVKTLSNWLRSIDPRPQERRAGRPRKNPPRP